jgi:hypothetical protein
VAPKKLPGALLAERGRLLVADFRGNEVAIVRSQYNAPAGIARAPKEILAPHLETLRQADPH